MQGETLQKNSFTILSYFQSPKGKCSEQEEGKGKS